MPRPGFGTIGGLARPHPGASGAVTVHVSPRNAVGAKPGWGFCGGAGGFGARDGLARTRRVAADALGIEWSGDPPPVGVGGAGFARRQLPLPTAPELAAAPRRRSAHGGTSVAPRLPARALCGEHADSASDGPPLGAVSAGGGYP